MFGSGNEPCAPRTQILASRLLDIIIHDSILGWLYDFCRQSQKSLLVPRVFYGGDEISRECGKVVNDHQTPVQPQISIWLPFRLGHLFQAIMTVLDEVSKE